MHSRSVLVRFFALLLACCGTTAALPAQPRDDAQILTERAERALDLKEIERLQRSYGYYIDHSDWDNVVDLLTEDATAEYGQSGIYVGKASIRGLLYGIGYGQQGLLPQQLREHTQLQPVVTLVARWPHGQGALARAGAAGTVQPVRPLADRPLRERVPQGKRPLEDQQPPLVRDLHRARSRAAGRVAWK